MAALAEGLPILYNSPVREILDPHVSPSCQYVTRLWILCTMTTL